MDSACTWLLGSEGRSLVKERSRDDSGLALLRRLLLLHGLLHCKDTKEEVRTGLPPGQTGHLETENWCVEKASCASRWAVPRPHVGSTATQVR